MSYEMVKRNFERKLWNARMVAIAVQKGIITAKQYEEITSETYTEAAAGK